MVSRKRARDEMETEAVPEEPTTLHKLRNMWQFSNLAQYLALFIDALRVDSDFDIEDLESECLKPQPSEKLAQIGLALLKHVSSHKGLTPEIFDEYARRQFVAKAPERNPFGTEETPNKFNDFDIFTKIRVLQQLSVWTLNNPNSIREKLNATDAEQVTWRVEPIGWDRDARTYFVLDDNRLYRQTDPPPPPAPKAKSKAKPRRKATRGSKRRKTSDPQPDTTVEEEDEAEDKPTDEPEDDGLGGKKWECLCITLEDYQSFLNSIRRSKDLDEKDLYQTIEDDIMPVINQQAEERAKKEARRQKEQEVLMKLATAKRSSRISSRLEKQKEEEAAAEAERKRLADIAMAKAEQEQQHKLEEDRDSRRMTREQRLREREAKRILEEEGLRKLKEDEEKLASNEAQARLSERHLKAEMKRREEELKKLKEEDEWVFDCEKCGVHGDSYDDGTQIIACDQCNVWQHTKCHGISAEQAARDDFHFVCSYCQRKEEEAKQPKLPPLKFKLTSASPNGTNSNSTARRLSSAQIPAAKPPSALTNPPPVQPTQPLLNGPSLSPCGQALGPPGIQRSEAAYGVGHAQLNGSSPAPSRHYSGGPSLNSSMDNGILTSSPPQYRNAQPATGPFTSFSSAHVPNGTSSVAPNPFQAAHNPNYNRSFSRPSSSAGPAANYSSPVKHSPAPSPKTTSGIPGTYNFTNSPHSSFPPSSTQQPSYSPTKNASSPPPPLQYRSSPAPIMHPLAQSPAQSPAQILPDPIPAPEKHDGARPVSSQSFSHTPILPPIQPLAPDAHPQNLSPPVKKTSPAPDRRQLSPQFSPVGGNVFNNGLNSNGTQH